MALTHTDDVYDFFPGLNDLSGQLPGMGNIYVADINKIAAYATEASAGTAPGDLRTLTGDVTFVTGYGWKQIQFYRGDSEIEGAAAGEPGYMTQTYTVKGFIPGRSAAIRELVEMMANKALLVLVQGPECTDPMYQLGCSCSYAVVKPWKFATGGRIKGGKVGYAIEIESLCYFDYSGVVTVQP
jgi:hypothetical protein